MDAPTTPAVAQAEEVQKLFVDEAGDSTLFNGAGESLVDTRGCSRFFMLGKIEVDDPARLAAALTDLHRELLADPYFDGVESFRPERNKTALLFHATDDVPEVRYLVFRLLRELGAGIRFHAVIRDKLALLERERAIRADDRSLPLDVRGARTLRASRHGSNWNRDTPSALARGPRRGH